MTIQIDPENIILDLTGLLNKVKDSNHVNDTYILLAKIYELIHEFTRPKIEVLKKQEILQEQEIEKAIQKRKRWIDGESLQVDDENTEESKKVVEPFTNQNTKSIEKSTKEEKELEIIENCLGVPPKLDPLFCGNQPNDDEFSCKKSSMQRETDICLSDKNKKETNQTVETKKPEKLPEPSSPKKYTKIVTPEPDSLDNPPSFTSSKNSRTPNSNSKSSSKCSASSNLEMIPENIHESDDDNEDLTTNSDSKISSDISKNKEILAKLDKNGSKFSKKLISCLFHRTDSYSTSPLSYRFFIPNCMHMNRNSLTILGFESISPENTIKHEKFYFLESYCPEMMFFQLDSDNYQAYRAMEINMHNNVYDTFGVCEYLAKNKKRQFKLEQKKRKEELFKEVYKTTESQFYEDIQVGGMVAARFSKPSPGDDKFYRAVVIDKNYDIISDINARSNFYQAEKLEQEKLTLSQFDNMESEKNYNNYPNSIAPSISDTANQNETQTTTNDQQNVSNCQKIYKITVWFIDYGNWAMTTNVKRDILPLHPKFYDKIPAQALPCTMFNLRSTTVHNKSKSFNYRQGFNERFPGPEQSGLGLSPSNENFLGFNKEFKVLWHKNQDFFEKIKFHF